MKTANIAIDGRGTPAGDVGRNKFAASQCRLTAAKVS